MNVAALQQFLRSLAQPMQSAGASQKVVAELEEAGQALEPFKDLDFAQFALFLRQADEYRRTGVLPTPARPARATRGLDPARLHELAQRATQLKERAAGADGPAEAIDAEFERLDLKGLSKKDVVTVARELGVRTTVRMTQDEVIDAIRRWALGRQETPAAAQTDGSAEAAEPAESEPVASDGASEPAETGGQPA